MKWLAILTSAVLAFSTQAAVAQDQEVVGEVIEASADANEIRIRVMESDDNRPERVGQTETYSVPPGTPIEVEEANRFRTGSVVAGAGTPEEVELSDLQPGDRVTIAFQESATGRQATGVRRSAADDNQQQQTAQQDRDDGVVYADESQSRDRLPGSASPLPLLALAGAGFGLIAGALRFRRRKQ